MLIYLENGTVTKKVLIKSIKNVELKSIVIIISCRFNYFIHYIIKKSTILYLS